MITVKKINQISFSVFAALLILSVVLSGCNATRTAKGGAIGSGVGGVIGGVIGKKSDKTAQGAILGAMLGGTAGALIGKYMDKQAEELEDDLKNAEVERVGEGIKITFDSGILFDFDSYKLRYASKRNLSDLAETLKKYEDTEVLIEGHTDSVGEEDYNQKLSEQRATSVLSYINEAGVKETRLLYQGYGESQPVASNETDYGRQKNRRVEVAIYANDKLRKAAQRGEI